MTDARRLNSLSLLGPCAFACAADVTMTLVGQPAAYWAGDRAAARDFNPLARLLLELHPMALPLAGVVELLGLALAFRRLAPRCPSLAYALAFVVTLAQLAAAGGWLIGFGPAGWVGAIVLLVIAERWLTRLSPEAARRPRIPQASVSG